MAALRGTLRSYGLAVACVVVSSVCAYTVRPYGHLADLAMVHLLGIVFLSLRSSVRVSVLASASHPTRILTTLGVGYRLLTNEAH